MKRVVIVGCGNIGYRHLEAASRVTDLDQIVVVDSDTGQLERVRTMPRVVAFDSIEMALADAPRPVCVVSAVTTDVQTVLMPKLLEFGAEHYLLEKPLAQSAAALHELSRSIGERADASKVFVNVSRGLWEGYQIVQAWMVADRARTRVHVDVTGNLWGLGCNGVHFLELFRLMTGANEIRPVAAQLAPSPQGNKRGPRYEEFVGTIGFANDHGDTLQLTSGAAYDEASRVCVAYKEKTRDALRFILEEKHSILVDVAEGRRIPFDSIPVSRTTTSILQLMLEGRAQELVLPTLAQAALGHVAFFDGLTLATGRKEFAIT